jgi:vancomycin permeability regulator SanA
MMISKTDGDLRKLLRKNGVPETIRALPGGKSRSTFEDVYQTAKVIKENQFSSVIVVTSSYHLPRSLFLLKVYLKILGQDVRIQGFAVVEAEKSDEKLRQYSNGVIKF